MDCLYIGKGEKDIVFMPAGARPPLYYFLSCPAHHNYPTVKISHGEALRDFIGHADHASRRTIYKYIHPGGARSCQLVMGLTVLEPGAVWNTMPPHLHSRRAETYLYFDLADGVVVHLMGRPEETRSLIVRDLEAVLSPSWSIHCGAGTSAYKFVWGMAGENQDFADMDPVGLKDLF
jgi:4-deoxy-L-threo-5-hexosulose-uronate ketol-isomerase